MIRLTDEKEYCYMGLPTKDWMKAFEIMNDHLHLFQKTEIHGLLFSLSIIHQDYNNNRQQTYCQNCLTQSLIYNEQLKDYECSNLEHEENKKYRSEKRQELQKIHYGKMKNAF